MRGAGRMEHQALGIPNVRQVRKQFYGVDKFLPCLQTSLDDEPDNPSEAALEVLGGQRVIGVTGKSRVRDPGHQRMAFQETRHG